MASRPPQQRRRNKNAVIDYETNLIPTLPAASKKKRKGHADPAIRDAVLSVGLPASPSASASTVSLPLPARQRPRGPSAASSSSNVRGSQPDASHSAASLPAPAASRVLVRQQSNLSARSLDLPQTEVAHAEAEIQAAMTRHDVYEGMLAHPA
jgi:hypothetical protein